MNGLLVLIIILFISVIGYAIIRGFNFLSSKDNLLAIGASYGLGVGLVTMQLYVYSRLGIAWEREFILFPWICLLLGVLIKNRKEIRLRLPTLPSLDVLEKLLLTGILLSFVYVIFEALLRPVVAWDAWANWLMQSKIFFTEGRINPQALIYIGSEYPLTINLLGTFIYILLGQVDDTAVLLTSTAFYAFLAITFFAVLKKRFGMKYALVFTFLLVTTQNFIRHGGRLEAGLADLPLGYFAFVSVVLLFEYLKNSSFKRLLLVNVFLGITAVIKVEGLPLTFFIVLCTVLHIYRKKLFSHLPIMIVWILPYVIWKIDRIIMNLPETYAASHALELSVKKSVNAVVGTIKELVNVKSWNLLWIVYVFTLVSFGSRKNKELGILNFIILCQFFLYILIYNVTAWHNPESSAERLFMHIAPLAFYSVAIVIHEQLKHWRKS